MNPHPLVDSPCAWGSVRSAAHGILTEPSFWKASAHLWEAAVLVFFWQEVDPDLGDAMMEYLKGVLRQGDIQPFCAELSGLGSVWGNLLQDLPPGGASLEEGFHPHPFVVAAAKAHTLLAQTQWVLWLGKAREALNLNSVRVLLQDGDPENQKMRKFYAFWRLEWRLGDRVWELAVNCDTTHPHINDPSHRTYMTPNEWEEGMGMDPDDPSVVRWCFCWDWLRFLSVFREEPHTGAPRGGPPALIVRTQSRIPIKKGFDQAALPFFFVELFLNRDPSSGEEGGGRGGWWLDPPPSVPAHLTGTPLHVIFQ